MAGNRGRNTGVGRGSYSRPNLLLYFIRNVLWQQGICQERKPPQRTLFYLIFVGYVWHPASLAGGNATVVHSPFDSPTFRRRRRNCLRAPARLLDSVSINTVADFERLAKFHSLTITDASCRPLPHVTNHVRPPDRTIKCRPQVSNSASPVASIVRHISAYSSTLSISFCANTSIALPRTSSIVCVVSFILPTTPHAKPCVCNLRGTGSRALSLRS